MEKPMHTSAKLQNSNTWKSLEQNELFRVKEINIIHTLTQVHIMFKKRATVNK